MARISGLAAALFVSTTAIGGCSVTNEGDAGQGRDPSASGGSEPVVDPNADAKPAPVGTAECGPAYHAYLKVGSCSDVAGKSGSWRARALFPDAPKDIRDAACTYRWRPTVAGAAADVDALSSLDAELLTRSNEEKWSCDAPRLSPSSLRPVPIAPSDPSDPSGTGPPTGVSGCDVCGRLAQGRLFVILPADKLNFRRFVVRTDAGVYFSFDVTPTVAGAQVFSAELPPAPNSQAYRQGRVTMSGATF